MQIVWFKSRGGFWFNIYLEDLKLCYSQKDDYGGQGGQVNDTDGKFVVAENVEDGKKLVKALTHYLRGYKMLTRKDKEILIKYKLCFP